MSKKEPRLGTGWKKLLDSKAKPVFKSNPIKPKHTRGKSKKGFTSKRKCGRIKLANKLERTTKMLKPQKRKVSKKERAIKKQRLQHDVRKFGWLIETIFRGYVGWIFLIEFDSGIAQAVAVYALVSASLIVIHHFLNSK